MEMCPKIMEICHKSVELGHKPVEEPVRLVFLRVNPRVSSRLEAVSYNVFIVISVYPTLYPCTDHVFAMTCQPL